MTVGKTISVPKTRNASQLTIRVVKVLFVVPFFGATAVLYYYKKNLSSVFSTFLCVIFLKHAPLSKQPIFADFTR